MADGSITIEINGDAKQLESSLKSVDSSLQSTNDAASNLANKGLKAIATAVAATSAALAAGAAAVISVGSAYETSFAKVSTIMDTSSVSTEDMSAAILDLSNNTGIASTAIADMAYNAISATGDTAGAISLVTDATKLATAGFADSGDALSVLTTAINAYGYSAEDAEAISDSLIETQNRGVLTLGELAGSMGKAIAAASSYSIDLNNLEAAYIAITKAGIPIQESTTYLSAMFKELGDNGSDVAEIIQNKTGKSFSSLMKEGYSLGDVLKILMDDCEGDTTAFMNLWSSAEAGRGAAAVAGQGFDTFNENLEALRSSCGTTEAAYKTMSETFEFQTNILKTRVSNLGTVIYESFSGAATDGVSVLNDAVADLTESIQNGALSDEMDSITEGLGNLVESAAEFVADALPGIIEAVSFLLDNAGSIAAGVAGVTASLLAFKAMTTGATAAMAAFNAVLAVNPAILAAAAIAGMVAVGITLGATYKEANPVLDELSENNKDIAKSAQDAAEAIGSTKDAWVETDEAIKGNVSTNEELIASLLEMVSAYDGTAGSAALIQKVVDQLNSSIPGLNLAFDEQSGALNQSAEAMSALNKQYAASQKYDNALKRQASAAENLASAQEALADANGQVEAAQAAVNAEQERYKNLIGPTAEETAEYEANMSRLGNTLDNAKYNQAQCTAAVNAAESALSAADKAVDSAATGYQVASDAAGQFATAEDDVAEAAAEVDAAVQEATQQMATIGLEAQNASGSAEELRAKYDELKGQYDELKGAGDEYIESLAAQELEQLNFAATCAEVGTAMGGLLDSTSYTISGISALLIESGLTVADWGEAFNSHLDNVVNGFEELDTSTQMSLADITANLESNAAQYAAWNTAAQEAWNMAVATGDASTMAMVQQLVGMGVSGTQALQDLVDGGNTALSSATESWSSATGAAADAAVLEIAMREGISYDEAAAMAQSGADGISSVEGDYESAGESLGEAQTDGYNSTESSYTDATDSVTQAGLDTVNDFEGQYNDAGVTLAEAVSDGYSNTESTYTSAAETVTQAGLDTVLSFEGQYTDAGVQLATATASGITDTQSTVTGAAESVASATDSSFRAACDWYSIGYYIDSGIASGISAGSSSVISAAVSTAVAAYNAAKSALDINSPSKLFRKIGQSIDEGWADGITRGAKVVTGAVDSVANSVVSTSGADVVYKAARDSLSAMNASGSVTNNYHSNAGTSIIQNIYSRKQSAAEIYKEAAWYIKRGVLTGATS